MIKFFRHIRKSLLMENKTGKYLKYAIGEIILVVIGILIALQINNWNLQAKSNQLKGNYLNRLISDIQQDTTNINYVVSEIDKNQTIIKKLTKSISTSTNYTILDSLITNYFRRGWMILEYISKDNTYIDLSQTGNMNIIKNNVLVDNIIQYYGYVQEIDNFNTVNKNWITPLDLELAKLTSAFELDPSTSELFLHKNRLDAIKNIQSYSELMERNAAGHYWMNASLSRNLLVLKSESKTLLKALQKERSLL